MATFGSVMTRINTVIVASRPYARYTAALVAGLAITFTQDHSTYTGLAWLCATVAVSLVLRDGPETILNKAAWWSTLVVAAMALLGILVGKMSTATALSLTIALVAFETSRAFTRSDRIWLWSTAVLASGLSILYFSVDANDTTAAGLTGGWAIIAGIFGLISAVDARIKASKVPTQSTANVRRPAPKSPTSTARATSASKTVKAKPRGTKR